MKDFFKGPVFRALLALLAWVVLSLTVWFLGPYLAVGDLHPLGAVSIRVSVILLLLAGLLSWALELSAGVAWTLLGAAALCLLIWHGGPLLGFGSVQPLAAVWARVLCIVLVLLCLLVWGIYKLYKALQQDEKLLHRWLHREGQQPALAREEIRSLAARARQAVGQLRQMRMTMAGGTGTMWSGLRRLVEGKRYLYELPWYMLIGQPGAGKSSVVLNAGLRFPMADQMGAASARLTLERTTGTQDCDWWLTNEAVFLDTAGRYTEQAVSDDEQKRLTNEAEWKGFLGVLRQVRPRAPINGALLVVDVVQLLQSDAQQRTALAAQLRARLEELRAQLGIRFPVYLLLAKADVLRGFNAYFSSLTSEARSQVWGFTLPWQESESVLTRGVRLKKSAAKAEPDAPARLDSGAALAEWVQREFDALVERIRAGVASRLQEEFQADQRQALYMLPHEMQGLQAPLLALIDALFADSRYDTTQNRPMLRGVYLTSAMQPGQEVTAQPHALAVRLKKAFSGLGQAVGLGRERTAQVSRRSFFLTDLMQKVVMAEAHLVKPNLRWEARMRLLRWIGHGVVLFLFFWLSGALTLSYQNNKTYLQEVSKKTEVLTEQMKRWLSDRSVQQTDKVLNLAQGLPLHVGLDLASPGLSYQYGLYSAQGIADVAQEGYGQLLDRLVLPEVVGHMEQVMQQAVAKEDARKAYETLRVYLMLHDGSKYAQSPDNARDVRAWVTQEWQSVQEAPRQEPANTLRPVLNKPATVSAPLSVAPASVPTPVPTPQLSQRTLSQRLGNSASMVGHLEWMFSGQRTVQSAAARNEALVRQVRAFLDKNSSSERLYERAKSAMQSQAPQEFSLVRSLGPQSGTLFSRASGASLEKGVPGLFTYDGYHNVFSKQLMGMLAWAQQDDAWVMGKEFAMDSARKKNDADLKSEQRELAEDIRRQFLIEYARQWGGFLEDIRLVRSDKSGTLAFDLSILRQLAAADSPLVRLARLAVRETTLSRSLLLQTPGEEKSIFDKAGDQLAEQKSKAATSLGVRPEQRAERQWVDDKFSALREVVTGQAEGAAGPSGGKAGLESMNNVLNEYYTVLVVADTAISAGSLPPAGAEAATKLRIEAGKLPAPLRDVLLDLSSSGADKVTQGASAILRIQAQTQMDRLVGMMAWTVSEPCQKLIAGRYPFANSTQEVAAEDFNSFFAAGGTADEYFRKHLAPLVDTSVRPWRYKSPASAMQMANADGQNPGQPLASSGPTLTGELLKLLAQSGPNPEAFAQIGQIREMFFRDNDGKRMGWKGEYKVVSLDASVTEWVIDMDGQVQRYAHGAVQSVPLVWPGPRGGTMAELHANPRIKSDTSSLSARGPWAWLRLMERGKTIPGTQTGKQQVEFMFDNRRAVLEIGGAGPSPFNSPVLRNFICPGKSV
jgi:type VI secretion system protein ImpL